MTISFFSRTSNRRSLAVTERGVDPDTEDVLRLKPRYPVEVHKPSKVLHRPSLRALISVLDCCRPALQIVGRLSSSCTIRRRWKIGRLNGRYLCGEECIALNILNDIDTLIESRNSGGSREVGRDYLGLEMPRRNLDGSTTYRPKTPGRYG